MLYIILLILKIIGIVLLSILALLIFLLCIFLFVPIRYQIKSDNEHTIKASASVTWLLHLVYFQFLYQDDFSYYLTIFGIKIYPKKNKDLNKKKSERKSQATAQTNKKSKIKIESKIPLDCLGKENRKEETKKAELNKKKAKEKRQKKKKSNIKFTFRNLYDKIKKNIHLIKKNIHRIKDERTKRAFLLCKKQLFHLLKLIIPRKINGIIELGMKDSSKTGELYGLYAAFFHVHKGKIVMIPYFDKEIFLYTITAIGRIRMFTILIIALKVYFNKDIQRLIYILKKEED